MAMARMKLQLRNRRDEPDEPRELDGLEADMKTRTPLAVVACSDPTVILRALLFPSWPWFDVALLVPQALSVLVLRHIFVSSRATAVQLEKAKQDDALSDLSEILPKGCCLPSGGEKLRSGRTMEICRSCGSMWGRAAGAARRCWDVGCELPELPVLLDSGGIVPRLTWLEWPGWIRLVAIGSGLAAGDRKRDSGDMLLQLPALPPAQPGFWGRAAAAASCAAGMLGASCRSGLRHCRDVGDELPQLPALPPAQPDYWGRAAGRLEARCRSCWRSGGVVRQDFGGN